MNRDTITPDLWLSLSEEQAENCPQSQLAPDWSYLLWLLSEDHSNSLVLMSVPIKSLFFHLLNQINNNNKKQQQQQRKQKPKQPETPKQKLPPLSK